MAASQVVPRGVYEKESVVRGHHIYKTVWTPVIGEELPVEREEDNQHDQHAVAVVKNGDIVGHIPRSIPYRLRGVKGVARGVKSVARDAIFYLTYTFRTKGWFII